MDIALQILATPSDFAADMFVEAADLAGDAGLRTAVIISLFSDAPADADDVLPDPAGDRRGWWGDAYAETPGDVTGSKLWLLTRSKATPQAFSDAEAYAVAALDWMVDDGVAASIEAVASSPASGWLALSITINRPQGQVPAKFDFAWRNS